MWLEAVEQCANMMAMNPYPGFKGEFFEMPCRNIVPKPVQKPHPPLWVACSNRETIKLAARLGIGALTFAFVDPREAKQWVDDYYRIFKKECVPIGHAVNPNIAMVTGFSVHPDAEEAQAARPGRLPLLRLRARRTTTCSASTSRAAPTSGASSRRRAPPLPPAGAERGIGTPDELRAHLRISRNPASTRWSSSSRAAATSTSTSARRSNCSRRT